MSRIISILLSPFILSAYYFYNIEKGNNDCMVTWVESGMKGGWWYKSYYSNSLHIDTKKIEGYGEILSDNVNECNSILNSIFCRTIVVLNAPFLQL